MLTIRGAVLAVLLVVVTATHHVGSRDQQELPRSEKLQKEEGNVESSCYTCTYRLRNGNVAGHDNCLDSFIKTDIPIVPCKGSCEKYYHKISDTEYRFGRSCLPNCQDVQDDMGYTHCCTGYLCNHGPVTAASSCLLTLSVIVSVWYSLR